MLKQKQIKKNRPHFITLTDFITDCSYLGPDGAKGVRLQWTLRKSPLSTWSATNGSVMNGSVVNVVCYEWVCCERGLF